MPSLDEVYKFREIQGGRQGIYINYTYAGDSCVGNDSQTHLPVSGSYQVRKRSIMYNANHIHAFLIICMAGIVSSLYAVNGFAVSVKGLPDYISGAKNGMVWRHDIRNNSATRHIILDSGACSNPAISPDGARIAYIKSGGLWVMDSNGKNKLRLISTGSVLNPVEFPSNSYIYIGEGTTLKRVTLSGVTQSWTLPFCFSQLNISNDLTRMIVRTTDNCGSSPSTIIAYDMTTLPATAFRTGMDGGAGSQPSCGSGIASDGQTYMDGWIDHDGFDVRRWSDASVVKSFSNASAFRWAVDYSKITASTEHVAFSSGCATNSPKWHCISNNQNQVLINWVDQQCFSPTGDLAGTSLVVGELQFSGGDFWVDATIDTMPIGIHTPVQGQSFAIGDTMTVCWVVKPAKTAGGVTVAISPDNGRNFYTISTTTIMRNNTQYYTKGDTAFFKWKVSQTITRPGNSSILVVSDSCRVRVQAPNDPGLPEDISGLIAIISPIGIPGMTFLIEAEDYSAQSGVFLEATQDTGGGQNIMYMHNGDWMEYAISVLTAGAYTAKFRVASLNSGGSFQLKSGSIISNIVIPTSGGWQKWQWVSGTANLVAGAQTIRITCVGTGSDFLYNFNKFSFTSNATGINAPSAPRVDPVFLKISRTKGVATVTINLAQSAPVHLDIFSLMGKRVATLANNEFAAGAYSFLLDKKSYPAGMYLCNLRAGRNVCTMRVWLDQ